MENAIFNTPLKEQFHLSKVKYISKEAAVEFTADQDLFDGALINKLNMKNVKIDRQPHPDLIAQLDQLQIPLATVHGLLDVSAVTNHKDFAATPAQKKFAEKHREEKLQNIVVTGITLSGADETRGVVITGTFDGQAINSKRIRFNGKSLGFEAELDEICDAIYDEFYAYLYENKKAQTDAFDAEQQPEPGV